VTARERPAPRALAADDPLVRVVDLVVADGRGTPVLDRISFDVRAGERVAVSGRSGAGKTTVAHALLGEVADGLVVEGGDVRIAGRSVLGASGATLRALRRRDVAYLAQDPSTTLTPTMRIGALVTELAADRSVAAQRRRLRCVGLPDDAAFLRRRPAHLSGGQRQRLAVARALSGDPRLVVVDEPTTGLDDDARAVVVQLLDRFVAARGAALVLISHDPVVVAALARRVVVLGDTRTLVADTGMREAVPPPAPPPTSSTAPPALELRDLVVRRGGQDVTRGLSVVVPPGGCVALVGPSGVGKTSVVRVAGGLERATGGSVRFEGVVVPNDVRRRSVAQLRHLQVVPQDPVGSLDHRSTARATVARPLRRLHGLGSRAAVAEAERLLVLVGIDVAAAGRRPGGLSGGQCQRVAIARALAARPRVLVCDEVTAGLDVGARDAIVDLVRDLRASVGLAVLLVSHDEDVVRALADHVVRFDPAVDGTPTTTTSLRPR
jgi:peptide/nickel transport system ATP-binding protein